MVSAAPLLQKLEKPTDLDLNKQYVYFRSNLQERDSPEIQTMGAPHRFSMIVAFCCLLLVSQVSLEGAGNHGRLPSKTISVGVQVQKHGRLARQLRQCGSLPNDDCTEIQAGETCFFTLRQMLRPRWHTRRWSC